MFVEGNTYTMPSQEAPDANQSFLQLFALVPGRPPRIGRGHLDVAKRPDPRGRGGCYCARNLLQAHLVLDHLRGLSCCSATREVLKVQPANIGSHIKGKWYKNVKRKRKRTPDLFPKQPAPILAIGGVILLRKVKDISVEIILFLIGLASCSIWCWQHGTS